jgi:hypothetical protein
MTPRPDDPEILAETGPGLPDEAVGPEQRTIPELTELAEAPEAERIARKLEAEAERAADEDAAEDPTGHA